MERRKRSRNKEEDLLQDLKCNDPQHLYVAHVDDTIGKGLFTKTFLESKQPVCVYTRKPAILAADAPVDHADYLFHFKRNGKMMCFDAFNPSQGIGRYANDEWSEPNCLMKRVPVKGEDSLFLYTLTDIQPHSELRYNYGDPSAPWRTIAKMSSGPKKSMKKLRQHWNVVAEGDETFHLETHNVGPAKTSETDNVTISEISKIKTHGTGQPKYDRKSHNAIIQNDTTYNNQEETGDDLETESGKNGVAESSKAGTTRMKNTASDENDAGPSEEGQEETNPQHRDGSPACQSEKEEMSYNDHEESGANVETEPSIYGTVESSKAETSFTNNIVQVETDEGPGEDGQEDTTGQHILRALTCLLDREDIRHNNNEDTHNHDETERRIYGVAELSEAENPRTQNICVAEADEGSRQGDQEDSNTQRIEGSSAYLSHSEEINYNGQKQSGDNVDGVSICGVAEVSKEENPFMDNTVTIEIGHIEKAHTGHFEAHLSGPHWTEGCASAAADHLEVTDNAAEYLHSGPFETIGNEKVESGIANEANTEKETIACYIDEANSSSYARTGITLNSSAERGKRQTAGVDNTDKGMTDTHKTEKPHGKTVGMHSFETNDQYRYDVSQLEMADENDETDHINVAETRHTGSVDDDESDHESNHDDCVHLLKSRFKHIRVEAYDKANGKRNYKKTNYCLFCKAKYVSKISKHYSRIHKQEARVKDILTMPLNSRLRKMAWIKLQNEGNFKHNSKVLRNNTGTLIVSRRPAAGQTVDASNYLPCEFCLGFFHRSNLWFHCKNCTHRGNIVEKNFLRNSIMMLAPFLQKADKNEEKLEEFYSRMKETIENPGVKKICFEDNLIREFAKSKLGRLGERNEQRRRDEDNIRTKVRTLGRLLKKINEMQKSQKAFTEYITGKGFLVIVEAVKNLSIDADSPNLALTCGHYLKHLCLLKSSLGIMTDNEQNCTEAKNFQTLFDAHWNDKVSCIASRRIKLRTLNKAEKLPSTSDLVALKTFLCTEIKKSVDESAVSIESWQHLAKCILVYMLLFNKRRISEVEEVTVQDYVSRIQDSIDDEILASLSASERALIARMQLIEVRGKSTRKLRKVFILVTDLMQEGLEYLLRTRQKAGIHACNPYLFARISKTTPLDGCTAVREITAMCPGLDNPQTIRSRLLRKYMATNLQILDMSDSELKLIADHMGHNINIHTDIYRLQSTILEKTKVAKVLTAFDNGVVARFKGQMLEDIDESDIPVVDFMDEWDESEKKQSESGEEGQSNTSQVDSPVLATKKRKTFSVECTAAERLAVTSINDDSPGLAPKQRKTSSDLCNEVEFNVEEGQVVTTIQDKSPCLVLNKRKNFSVECTTAKGQATPAIDDVSPVPAPKQRKSSSGLCNADVCNLVEGQGVNANHDDSPCLEQKQRNTLSGKEPRRKRWSADETAVLNEKFGPYIGTVRETDIKDILPRLPGRTAAQVRARLNNMKLGKSK